MSEVVIRESLHLGVLAWRKTPSGPKFLAAQDALTALLAERDALAAEVRQLRKVETAARVVDDEFLSANGPPFRFDRKLLTVEAETALLILHDTLNDVLAAAEAAR